MNDKLIYYEVATENEQLISTILSSYGIKPTGILTPVGGAPWPNFFDDIYPDAEVISFDINAAQINMFKHEVLKATGRKPILADISDPAKLERLLENSEADLLFLSNIPDYVSPELAVEMAQVIIGVGVPWVLMSHMADGNPSNGYQAQGVYALIETLQPDGYTIFEIQDTSGKFEITTFYLAMLQDEEYET